MRDVQRARVRSLGLAEPVAADPVEVVARLGAVQAQELPSSSWGVGQRVADSPTKADVDAAIADGSIVRTHVLRPTWHYVTSADLPPLMAATAPRVRKIIASIDRQHGVDRPLLDRCHAVISEALKDGPLTRAQLRERLTEAGVENPTGLRLAQVMMHAELDLIVGSGPLRGKSATYRLLSEIVPESRKWSQREALVHLVRAYVAGHGPCRAEDVAWWASLPVTQCREIMPTAGLERHERDGMVLWTLGPWPEAAPEGTVRLLSVYDEFFCHDFAGWRVPGQAQVPDRWTYAGIVIHDGVVVGAWARTLRSRQVDVVVELDEAVPSPALWEGIQAEAARYGAFLGLEAVVTAGVVGRMTV